MSLQARQPKARTKLTKTFVEKIVADFRNLILLNKTQAMKMDFAK